MSEIALGHASLSRRADLAFCPLDFQSHHGTLKIWLSGGRFRDRRDAVDCEGDGSCPTRYRIATPMLPDHSPRVRNAAGLKGQHHTATDRGRMCREVQIKVLRLRLLHGHRPRRPRPQARGAGNGERRQSSLLQLQSIFELVGRPCRCTVQASRGSCPCIWFALAFGL